jgi:hypothetical protein
MNMRIISAMLLAIIAGTASGQENKADTVIVPLAKTSQIIFTIQDRSDLEILKHYNFQDLFQDVLTKIEQSDTLKTDSSQVEIVKAEPEENWNTGNNDEENDNEEDVDWDHLRRGKIGRTWQSSNVDFGTNNFLAGGQFPDGDEPYAVRPWGSWYVGFNSVQRTRMGKNFFLEWGLGVSWYNFKFEHNDIIVQKDELGVQFITDTRDVNHIKSKLTATYINFSLIPLIDFGDHGRKARVWDGHGSEFRFGIGPYVGYRIASKSKLVFEEEGERERQKDRDSYYLNNLRYGARVQLGFRSTDFFFNYDANELFAENKGPKLNAISFGFIF